MQITNYGFVILWAFFKLLYGYGISPKRIKIKPIKRCMLNKTEYYEFQTYPDSFK